MAINPVYKNIGTSDQSLSDIAEDSTIEKASTPSTSIIDLIQSCQSPKSSHKTGTALLPSTGKRRTAHTSHTAYSSSYTPRSAWKTFQSKQSNNDLPPLVEKINEIIQSGKFIFNNQSFGYSKEKFGAGHFCLVYNVSPNDSLPKIPKPFDPKEGYALKTLNPEHEATKGKQLTAIETLMEIGMRTLEILKNAGIPHTPVLNPDPLKDSYFICPWVPIRVVPNVWKTVSYDKLNPETQNILTQVRDIFKKAFVVLQNDPAAVLLLDLSPHNINRLQSGELILIDFLGYTPVDKSNKMIKAKEFLFNRLQIWCNGNPSVTEFLTEILTNDLKKEFYTYTKKHPLHGSSSSASSSTNTSKNILKWTAIVILLVLLCFLSVYFRGAIFQMGSYLFKAKAQMS